MGEAKRRKAEIDRLKSADADWLASLSPTERTIVAVTQTAYERIVVRRGLVGGCYLLAFFLHELLQSQYRVATDLIVGWVNDGTWGGMASHAWVELGGKKIDISLVVTEYPDVQPSGDLIILDRVMRSGNAKYTYHRELSAAAAAHLRQIVSDGHITMEAIERKDQEHAHVLAMSRAPSGVRKFLDNGPSDRTFYALAALMA
jgi:hypothetical protein